MNNFSRAHRDSSLPPSGGVAESEESEEMVEMSEAAKSAQKRRAHPNECESLSEVQAYTLLNNATENTGRIET